MVAKRRGFSDRLVDHGVERNDFSHELAPNRLLRGGPRGAALRHRRADPIGDLGDPGREPRRKPPPGAAEVGPGEHDPGAHDADPDLADAEDREHERVPVWSSSRAELIAGYDGGG